MRMNTVDTVILTVVIYRIRSGAYLPEETRSTTINMFRIPLNLIVIVILYQVSIIEFNFPGFLGVG